MAELILEPFKPHLLPLEDLDWSPFIRLISKANRLLSKYDGIIQKIPNSELLLSPLMTKEAVLSSRIEGTQATLEDVFEFEADPTQKTPKYDDIQEIINYREAMRYAVNELKTRPMNLNLIKKMHFILMDSVRGKDKRRGEFRKDQNWIGKKGTPVEEATFVPPSPLELMEYLSIWEKYIHYDEQDPLVQLAIIHAQFEIIHPFLDGNGRVGRMALPLILLEKESISSPVLYLSGYLEANRDEYYQRLLNITQSDKWTEWIRFFLNAVIEQSKENTQKANEILQLYENMKPVISDTTKSPYAISILDTLFHSPWFSSSQFIRLSEIPRRTVLRVLNILTTENILYVAKKKSGRSPQLYVFPALLDIVK